MILRWLDRMKPSAQSAQISPHPPVPPNRNSERFRHLSNTNKTVGAQKTTSKTSPHDSSGKMLFSPLNILRKSFPVLPMMMQPTRINSSSQRRHFSYSSFSSVTAKRKDLIDGVFRKDIAQLRIRPVFWNSKTYLAKFLPPRTEVSLCWCNNNGSAAHNCCCSTSLGQ